VVEQTGGGEGGGGAAAEEEVEQQQHLLIVLHTLQNFKTDYNSCNQKRCKDKNHWRYKSRKILQT